MDQKFFITPFANAGDKAAVPDGVQPSGVVSYASGWGFDYQRTLGTDPSAKPVDRASMNQLGYDLTLALGALQRKAFPEFITAANNGGSAFAYGPGVIVMFNPGSGFVPYVSLVAANTAVPGTDAAKWQPALYAESSNAQAVAGTDATTVMTPRRVAAAIAALGASVPDATTAVSGKTRYATTAETNAITVTNAAVTPSGLGNFSQKTGAELTGHYNWRNRNAARFFDSNNDIACLDLFGGLNAPTDRGGTIINRNVGGSIGLRAGNGSSEIVLTPTAASVNVPTSITGSLTVSAGLTASGVTTTNGVAASTTTVLTLAATGSGMINLRPNGAAVTTGQMQISSAGNVTAAGAVTAAGLRSSDATIGSTGTSAIVGVTSAGSVTLRPDGFGSTAGQLQVTSGGAATLNGTLTVSGQVTAPGGVKASNMLVTNGADATNQQLVYDAGSGNLGFRCGTGSARFARFSASNGALEALSGPVTATGGFQNTSSHKVKDFDGPIEYTLDDLLRIETNVGSFKPDFLDEGGRKHLFFNAEQFRTVVREPVIDDLSEYNGELIPGMDPSQVCVLLVKLLQDEVRARRTLEAQLAEIETRLANLGA